MKRILLTITLSVIGAVSLQPVSAAVGQKLHVRAITPISAESHQDLTLLAAQTQQVTSSLWEYDTSDSCVAPGNGSRQAMRERVLANIADSKASREASNFQLHVAGTSQLYPGYGGVDDWAFTQLKKGDIVFGGVPGQTAFYTDLATVKASGLDSAKLFKSLQVMPHEVFGYRKQVMAYRVLEDMKVPSGLTLANPQNGAGGGFQYFIKSFEKNLEAIRPFDLK